MNWEQVLWDMMCELYRKMGGNCADLPLRPSNPPQVPSTLPAVIDKVEDRFDSFGIPSFGSIKEKQDFLALLTALENHLNASGNSLPLDSDAQLRTLIAEMRAAVP